MKQVSQTPPEGNTLCASISLAERHIALLTGSPATQYHFRLIHDCRDEAKSVSGTLEDLWPEMMAAQNTGFGVFVVVNEGGGDDKSIKKVRANFTDGDNIPRPATWHREPSFFVWRDATHWHAYWAVWDQNVDEFRAVQSRLATHYGTDIRVCNPSRVMRLAGTLHLKNPAHPFLMQLAESSAWAALGAYETAEILDGLPTVREKLAEKRTAAPGVELDHPRHIARARAHLELCAKDGRVAIEGQGGDAFTLQMCNKMLDLGCTPATGLDLMLELWNDACAPPWGRNELEAKMVNAATYRENDIGCDDTQPASEVFAKIAAKAPEPVGPSSFKDLLARDVKPPAYLIAGLVEKGLPVMLAGPGGVHKSRTALHWGLSIAAGVPVYGRPVERAHFLYLSYEDEADEVARRVQAMAKRLELPIGDNAEYWDFTMAPEPVAIVTDAGVKPQKFYSRLHAHLKAIPGHKVVVADSTYNVLLFTGHAQVNEAAVMAAIGLLRKLCLETDSTILFLWHPSQAGQERGDASGWSVAWHNAPRARLSLSAAKNGDSGCSRELSI